MLKLIIADDERIIRETISTIIDWSQYGIELAGLCSNGIEAYNMILDESPDLVITDIRMPGMNGLELIGRISETDLDTQFILLSGYGEFEYAKQAMKYGVRHYLLKPCNEQQIIDAVKESVSDCYAKRQARRILDSQFSQADSIRHNVVSSIINDALYLEKSLDEIIPTYEPYMDFYFTPYRLFYIYYLEQENLEEFLGLLSDFAQNCLPQVSIYGIYVRNTFLIFCQDISFDFGQLKAKLDRVSLEGQHTSLELQIETYSDLKGLFGVVLEKIRRFSTFSYVNNYHALCTCNYTAITQETENYCRAIAEGSASAMESLMELISDIMDIRFLKQLSGSMFLKITLGNPNISGSGLTEWLMQAEGESDLDALKESVFQKLTELMEGCSRTETVSSMTRQIFTYIRENLENPNLTLKYIAEQHLYMNVDYVSRKFQKETGIRFSDYLTNERIQKAKEYIENEEMDRISDIAERVGFGNNPQYFSQLFKKKTGMAPSAYITGLRGPSGPAGPERI